MNDLLVHRGEPFNSVKPTTNHWYNVAIATSKAHININLLNQKNTICVEIYIDNDKKLYDHLYNQKEQIEKDLGFKLDWRRLEDKKASRIMTYIDDHNNYPELMNETIDLVIKMRDLFSQYIN